MPEGEVYVRRREPARRARLLHRQRRLGDAVPHARAWPVVRQHPVPAAHDARRPDRRRGRRHLQRRPGPRGGGSMSGSLTDANVVVAREIIGRLPRKKSAMIPLLHLAQEQDGYVTEDAMQHIARAARASPSAEVLGVADVLRDVQVRAGRHVLHQRVHGHLVPPDGCVGAGRARRARPRRARTAAPPTTGCSRSRTSSASPPAPRRRRCRSTTATATRSPPAKFEQLVDDLRAGRSPTRSRRTARSPASASAPPTNWAGTGQGRAGEGRRPLMTDTDPHADFHVPGLVPTGPQARHRRASIRPTGTPTTATSAPAATPRCARRSRR